MKIVMLCDFYNPFLQYQENFLSKYYIKQGHQVTIVASTFDSIFNYMSDKYDRRILANENIIDGVKIIKLPYSLNILNKLRKFGGVDKILDTEKPDIIFAHNIHLNLKEAKDYKKKNPNIKIIMDYHADYSNSASNWLSINILHKIIRKKILYYNLGYIDKIYPIVPASSVFLNEIYDIPYERMELLPLGTDTDKIREVITQNRGKKIREKLKIPTDAIVIFTGGKLTQIKKTHLLIEALLSLSDPRLYLIIVGTVSESDLPYKTKLEAMVCDNKHIHFTGWLEGEEIYDYMNASDFAVFPASQSVLWQQSIGMGLPLIIGPVVDVNGKKWIQDAEYLNVNNNVMVLDKDKINVAELTQKMKILIDNPVLLNTMKAGALKTSEEFLSYDKIVQRTLIFDKKS